MSLARVEIDLPAALDSRFKLDVTKSRLDPGPEFGIAMLTAASKTGITFKKYQLDAQSTYRKQKVKDRARFPMIPGAGMPVRVQHAVADILREEGTGRPHKIAFIWAALDNDEVVRISAGSKEILLNKRFRKELAEGTRSDAPVLKMLFLFLLQDHLEKTVNTKITNEWLQRVNLALLASLKA